ncbi:MAG: hypothetical protein JNL21_38070 [Myxococcales bacterium]|nr:hypothetical protein [Myxococcales bacterium]
MTAETQGEQSGHDAALIGKLQGEINAAAEKPAQAALLHELGVLHEARGEEPLAARDYLAAYNADADFREPLEALIRVLSRRRSYKNLAKLLDAMAKNAPTPEERARALRELAVVALEHDKNRDEARQRLEEAVAENPDDLSAWLELEMLAHESADPAGVMRAIEARLPLITDGTYKALLYIQLAELAAKLTQTQRSYEYLDAAAALEGRARFQTRVSLERIAQGAADLDALARALEGQAELVAEVLDDPERGEEIGVPRHMRTAAFAAEAWMRAAEIRRRLGDVDGAGALLSMAARRLPGSSVIARARLAVLEAQGDLEASATLAREELVHTPEGPHAASLWLRVAESAALVNDRTAALDALRHALTADPGAIPARAIEIDLLVDGQDPAGLAGALEGCATTFVTDAAKSRAFVLAAYVWACLVRDPQAAQTALSRAGQHGVSPAVTLRTARMFAAVISDLGWFEASTEQLLSAGAEPHELAGLWFELGRSRLLRGDIGAAEEAFAQLAQCEGLGAFARAPWLGRMLAACAVGLAPDGGRRSPEAMDALAAAEADPSLARGLTLVAALRANMAGDAAGARTRLAALAESSPGDVVVALFLAELSASDPGAAAAVLSRCAEAVEDADLAAGLRLEAGLYYWRAGDRPSAVAEISSVRDVIPGAANALLTWARRGLETTTLDGRREAVGDGPNEALERFGLEIAWLDEGGEVDAALRALEQAEQQHGSDDRLVAATLGRLLFELAGDPEAAGRALDTLESRGNDAAIVARAERFRATRDWGQDLTSAAALARAWAEIEPAPYVALEWLGVAMAAQDREGEVVARSLLADLSEGAARESLLASAVTVSLLSGSLPPPLDAQHAPGRLANLEMAPPGADPRRRAAALHGLEDSLGGDAYLDALVLAGYSDLANGDPEAALEAFKAVADARPDDLAAWEGARAAAVALDQPVEIALASAQLGALCKDDERGARFWEEAGLVLLERTEAHEDAEIALDRAFSRDPRSSRAFDKLFRRVRGRNENDRLLGLIERRLEVAEDETEIAKLFWERARVMQKKGDADGALAALENVTMLEPDHVGALALAGTICIQKGDFAGAAPLMARLSQIKEAPKQERLVSGVTACDLYENKLNQPEKALEVLVALHREGLTTLPVRERLARAAARTGAWSEATGMLEQLMVERAESEGRVEAARLAMAIWRDKIKEPANARAAVKKLLDECPDDPEGLELVLQTPFDDAFRTQLLARGKQRLVESLQEDPCDVDRVSLLARIAAAQGDLSLRQATLGVLVALGKPDRGLSDELASLDQKILSRPQQVLDGRALGEIADPQDSGPVPKLFVHIAETVTLALGPSLESLQVGRKNRVDAKGGPPLRLAVAEWMGALGFDVEFELYVGGPAPRGVQGVVVGETPALVVGSEISVPLDPGSRSAIAREVFALRRGISSLRRREDAAIASVVIAVCNEVGAAMQNPGYAVYAEVSRAVHKEISRRVRKAATESAQEVARSGQDPKAWAATARRSIDRMAALAAGDVSHVISDILNLPRHQLAGAIRESDRALSLLRFVLSPGYLELRRQLGMGTR